MRRPSLTSTSSPAVRSFSSAERRRVTPASKPRPRRQRGIKRASGALGFTECVWDDLTFPGRGVAALQLVPISFSAQASERGEVCSERKEIDARGGEIWFNHSPRLRLGLINERSTPSFALAYANLDMCRKHQRKRWWLMGIWFRFGSFFGDI